MDLNTTELVPLIATQEDRDHAWRHAFCYADSRVSTDNACLYADHYMFTVKDEENLFLWPEHSKTFWPWVNTNGISICAK